MIIRIINWLNKVLQQLNSMFKATMPLLIKLKPLNRIRELQGNGNAQCCLGGAYDTGAGVSEVVKWYKLAAEQGNANALCNLGSAYFEGVGVSINKVEAIKWYRLAAAQGFAKAQFNLGASYSNGDGVSVDKVESMT
jgi:TPR repeat protein